MLQGGDSQRPARPAVHRPLPPMPSPDAQDSKEQRRRAAAAAAASAHNCTAGGWGRSGAMGGRRGARAQVRAGAGAGAGSGTLGAALVARGMMPAGARPAELHPFVAAVAGGGPAEGGAVVGLLAWPRAGPPPVVRAAPGARGLEFLARSPEEYVARALAEEDLAGGPGPVAAAVAAVGGGCLYEAGSAAASPMPNQNAYLTKEVGIFPDVVAGLVEGHLGRGDATSALVAAEWFAKNHFAGSGQPWAFAAATLAGQGRREEAREYFQLALQRPWWTLEDLAGVLAGAGLEGTTAEEVRERVVPKPPPGEAAAQPESPSELLIRRAERLLDDASFAGEPVAWDSAVPELRALYDEAGLPDFAAGLPATC